MKDNPFSFASDEQYLRFLKNQAIPVLFLLFANMLWVYFEKEGIGKPGWTLQPPVSDFSPLNLIRVSAYLLGGYFSAQNLAHPMLGPAYAALFLFFLDHVLISIGFLYCAHRQTPGVVILSQMTLAAPKLLISLVQNGGIAKAAAFVGGLIAGRLRVRTMSN